MLNLHPWLVVVQTRCDMFVAAADRDLSRNKRAKQLLHHVVAKFMRFLLSVQLRHVQRGQLRLLNKSAVTDDDDGKQRKTIRQIVAGKK
jgi:hypothetical protein